MFCESGLGSLFVLIKHYFTLSLGTEGFLMLRPVC